MSITKASRWFMLTTVIPVAVLAFTGCASGEISPVPTKAIVSKTSAPSTPTSSAAVDTSALPLIVDCDKLIDLETLYKFNSNFSYDPNATPDASAKSDVFKSLNGTVCTYINLSSGDTITVAAAHPGAAELSSLQSDPSLGKECTFTVSNGTKCFYNFDSAVGVGIVQLFNQSTWLVLESSWFENDSDSENLVLSALKAVG